MSSEPHTTDEECLSLADAILCDLEPAEAASLTRLLPSVYADLRKRAAGMLRGERAGHTLQPTALVHDAYLRLAGQHELTFQNRAHFVCIAARMMRRVLTNHAIARAAGKRGGDNVVRLTLDDELDFYAERDVDLLGVNEALDELEKLDQRQARIVELRFFAGMTVEETAAALDISTRTVKREWATAKHWLRRELAKAA